MLLSMTTYQHVGVTVKTGLSHRDEAVHHILQILNTLGCTVLLDPQRCTDLADAKNHNMYHSQHELDLLIVIGGDGSILRAVREMGDCNVPILSVNMGVVGFLAELHQDEIDTLLPALINGEGYIDERSLLEVAAFRDSTELHQGWVLNEAVISQGSIARLIDLRTTVGNEDLTIFRADGLIIATPTGSSAYSLAAGGPIVHPQLAASVLTPINPQSFSQKPIVVPSSHSVEVKILTRDTKFHKIEVSLTLDGQTFVQLESGDVVRASVSNRKARFVRRKNESFYATLRNKLKWGERVEEY
jgi:NAD+ kinase